MALYAAYGSNMDAEQMLRRCPHSPTRGNGWLLDWRLTFGGEELGWEGALATIVEETGGTVFVQLYDVSPLDERQLDGWAVSYTHLRAHETVLDLVCRLLLEKKKNTISA